MDREGGDRPEIWKSIKRLMINRLGQSRVTGNCGNKKGRQILKMTLFRNKKYNIFKVKEKAFKNII